MQISHFLLFLTKHILYVLYSFSVVEWEHEVLCDETCEVQDAYLHLLMHFIIKDTTCNWKVCK